MNDYKKFRLYYAMAIGIVVFTEIISITAYNMHKDKLEYQACVQSNYTADNDLCRYEIIKKGNKND